MGVTGFRFGVYSFKGFGHSFFFGKQGQRQVLEQIGSEISIKPGFTGSYSLGDRKILIRVSRALCLVTIRLKNCYSSSAVETIAEIAVAISLGIRV